MFAVMVPIVLGVAAGRSYVNEASLADPLHVPADTAEPINALRADEITSRGSFNEATQVSGGADEAEKALAKLKNEARRSEVLNASKSKELTVNGGMTDYVPAADERRIPKITGSSGGAIDRNIGVKKEERPVNILAVLMAQKDDGARVFEPENTDARVIVRARADLPVQILSRTGDYLWSRTMRRRDMMLVPNRDDLELWTTNAAGVELLLDGEILPPPGPAGTIIGNLPLAPAALEASLRTPANDRKFKPTF